MSSLELTNQSLFGRLNRAEYEAVLASCQLITACYQEGNTSDNNVVAEAQARLVLAQASTLLGELPSELAENTSTFIRGFVKSIYLWLRLPESAGRVLFDSVGCQTLALYPVDMVLSDNELLLVDETLHSLGVPTQLLQEVKGAVRAQTSNSQLKRMIARFCSERLSAEFSNFNFFQQCYGDLDLPETMVDVVITDAQIFLCVPYDENGLIDQKRYAWNQQQQQEFIEFIQRLAMDSTTERTYFPSVGAFDKGLVNDGLVCGLTSYIRSHGDAYSAVSTAIVLETLGTMLLLVASQEVDKFLIHDAWGHSWQETLCDFEWHYLKMGKLREPISFIDPSIYSEGNRHCIVDCFGHDSHGVVNMDSVKLDLWLQADIQGRLSVALNACVAELTADLPEYKFSEVAQANGLKFPSSSLLDSQIVRLDLTFNDAAKHVESLAFPYSQLVLLSGIQQEVKQALVGAGWSEQESVVMLGLFITHVNNHYGTLLSTVDNGFSLLRNNDSLSLLDRLKLNVCSIYCSLHDYFLERDCLKRELPKETFSQRYTSKNHPEFSSDFIMIAMAVFFEEDRTNNSWHLDEIINGPLKHWIGKFGEEWRRRTL